MDTIGNTKQISDYLHLYLGCDLKIKAFNEAYYLNGSIQKLTPETLAEIYDGNDHKPILRPLSDMTEEEARVILPDMPTENKLIEWGYYNEYSEGNVFYQYLKKAEDERLTSILEDSLGVPEHWLSLLSKGFDLFGLRDAGLAIDKTKL